MLIINAALTATVSPQTTQAAECPSWVLLPLRPTWVCCGSPSSPQQHRPFNHPVPPPYCRPSPHLGSSPLWKPQPPSSTSDCCPSSEVMLSMRESIARVMWPSSDAPECSRRTGTLHV